MKSRPLMLITMTVFAALAIPLRLAAQQQQEQNKEHHRYRVTDLGTLGGTFGFAEGINNKDWVDGYANLPGDTKQHAFLWRHGLKIDLGTLGGPNSQAFLGPNNRGQVVGLAETSAPDPNNKNFCFFGTGLICRAFLWHNDEMTDLGTLGGNNSSAFDINNRGQVVGGAENATPDPTCTTYQFEFKPVIWEEGEVQELPTFSGDRDGLINAINDHGQAVGASGNCTNVASSHALFWQNGTPTDLRSLGGTMNNLAFDINNQGQVVGTSDLTGDTTHHAFLWQNGQMTDLGTLDFASAAFWINNKGQVVGVSCDITFMNCRALLWQNGVMTDLNTLTPTASPLHLYLATDINSRGEIVGLAVQKSTGKFVAFLATPCDQDNGNTEGCWNDDADTPGTRSGTSKSPKVTLPDNVRNLLQRRLRFGRFEAGPMRPQ
jgi:probable HAF family extracellular repeat protein